MASVAIANGARTQRKSELRRSRSSTTVRDVVRIACGLVVALALASCRGDAAPRSAGIPVERAFYYWKTTFRLSPAEEQALADLHVSRIYLRAFDIVWNDVPEFAGQVALAPGAHPPT